MSNIIPKSLLEQIRMGQVVLFLGAGASFDAKHPKNRKIPLGPSLGRLLADRFLGEGYHGVPLSEIAAYSISESGLFTVQDYLAEIFSDFSPAPFHLLIPKFCWASIVTTNYDQILEKAYRDCQENIQEIIPFIRNEDRIASKLREQNTIPYIKLHGCITVTHDPKLPLILTPEQYIEHMKGRNLLFGRLEELAYNYAFIFAGYRIADSNIRKIMMRTSSLGDARPRSYLLTPSILPAEENYWSERKVSCIKMTFKDFLHRLDSLIEPSTRILARYFEHDSHPICKKFSVPSSIRPSERLLTYLDEHFDYLYTGMPSSHVEPKAFYSGFFSSWGAIEQNLDVNRRLTEVILSEFILPSDEIESGQVELCVVKAHAGSGKTVLLHRIAWDSAHELEKVCLFLKSTGFIEFEYIVELCELYRGRLHIFIDDLPQRAKEIDRFIQQCKEYNLSVSIVGVARSSDWNQVLEFLDQHVTHEYELRYLNENEIEQLLTLLEKHDSLGYLERFNRDERKEALRKRAGRQLLVALHETTKGRPFEEIVFDEFKRIVPAQAQSLYLTVCIFHRLGINTRAGLISRIHGISFSRFKDELFLPLEKIIIAKRSPEVRDYVYQTRHRQIAELVFEQALLEPQERFDEYSRIISVLDIAYETDWKALRDLLNARQLEKLFPSDDMVVQLFDIAESQFADESFILQQRAIFEMHRKEGSLEYATRLLEQASKKSPRNRSIKHSKAELALKRSENAKTSLERQRWINECRTVSSELIKLDNKSPHPQHTLLKVSLAELREMLPYADNISSERKISEVEKKFNRAIQLFPNDMYILEAESRFCEILKDQPKAISALEKAFETNKSSPYLALRLAKLLKHNNKHTDAVDVLRQFLDVNQFDKDVNYQLGLLLLYSDLGDVSNILHHLRRGFTKGDRRFDAQFQYARVLYINGELQEAVSIFNDLKNAELPRSVKFDVRGYWTENKQPVRFFGKLIRREATFGFVLRDGVRDKIYCNAKTVDSKEWRLLKLNSRVEFTIGFNYLGPVVFSVRRSSK